MTGPQAAAWVQAYLVGKGIGVDPTTSPTGTWPIYYESMPDETDNAIAVYSTVGRPDGRLQRSGETIEHPGIQVKVRAAASMVAQIKMSAVADALDQAGPRTLVAITVDATTYRRTITSISRGGIRNMGQVPGPRPRSAYSINGLVSFAPN